LELPGAASVVARIENAPANHPNLKNLALVKQSQSARQRAWRNCVMQTRQNVFVQVFNKAVGLAIPENNGYRFVAAKRYFRLLEKRHYDSVAAIEAAAAEIYTYLFLVELVPVRVQAKR
jgi:hypothetical protein